MWCFAGRHRVIFRCDKDESDLKWKIVLLPFGLVTAFAERVYNGIGISFSVVYVHTLLRLLYHSSTV